MLMSHHLALLESTIDTQHTLYVCFVTHRGVNHSVSAAVSWSSSDYISLHFFFRCCCCPSIFPVAIWTPEVTVNVELSLNPTAVIELKRCVVVNQNERNTTSMPVASSLVIWMMLNGNWSIGQLPTGNASKYFWNNFLVWCVFYEHEIRCVLFPSISINGRRGKQRIWMCNSFVVQCGLSCVELLLLSLPLLLVGTKRTRNSRG